MVGAIPVEPLPLYGQIVLVVEDEFLIAEDIAAMLREAGAEVVGPAASLSKAIRLAGETERIDAALLNINLGGVAVYPLVDELQQRGVPILFLTGYGESQIPDEYQGISRCNKPTPPAHVVHELKQLVRPVAA